MKKDLVCGMMVDKKSPPERFTYRGEIYYFCSSGCKAEFEKNPEKFIARENENRSETATSES